MNSVYIIASAMLPVVKSNPKSSAAMGADVLVEAMGTMDRRPTALFVGNMMSGMFHHQTQLGALVAEEAGLSGIEVHTIDGACASGGLAMRAGYTAIMSGEHSVVAVVGVEKMSTGVRPKWHEAELKAQTRALATASNWRKEGKNGETFVTLNGRLHEEYISRFCPSPDVFAPFSINAHANANRNPYAFLHKVIDFEAYKNARVINDPIRLYDASPICDGAACVLLVTEEIAWEHARKGGLMIRVAGSAVATDTLALDDREDIMWLKAAELSAKKAFGMSGLEPEDIDFIEPHDAYNVITCMSLEASGFATKGLAWMEIPMEGITIAEALPICTQGGLKARGHPVGATGVYQIAEAYRQFIMQGGENQLDETPMSAFVQNIGGTGATVATHILVRE